MSKIDWLLYVVQVLSIFLCILTTIVLRKNHKKLKHIISISDDVTKQLIAADDLAESVARFKTNQENTQFKIKMWNTYDAYMYFRKNNVHLYRLEQV